MPYTTHLPNRTELFLVIPIRQWEERGPTMSEITGHTSARREKHGEFLQPIKRGEYLA
jgi:hypothetical protein